MRLGLLLLLLLALPVAAQATPAVKGGGVFPGYWSPLDAASAAWVQEGMDGGQVSVRVQVEVAPGTWDTRYIDPGPLRNGGRAADAIPVGDLEGRHLVRVVVDGAEGSPLVLGELKLDRTPPAASDVTLTSNADGLGTAVASWVQNDGDGSGTDPGQPTVVEVNASAAGDGSGAWLPFDFGAPPGDGPRSARTTTVGLTEGPHLVRVRSVDIVGNSGGRVLGVIHADRRPPVVAARVARAPAAGERSVTVAYSVEDPSPGSGIAEDARALVTGPAGGAPLGDGPAGPGEQTAVARMPGTGTFSLVVRVADRSGLVGRSAPLLVTIPAAAPAEPAAQAPIDPAPVDPWLDRLTPIERARGPGPAVLAAYRAAQRLHARRGARLDVRVVAARTAAEWRRMLGTGDAGRYEGYATFTGDVLLGPRVTAGLEVLARARARAARAGHRSPGRPPPRADLDRMATALAVLLHETIHATGPATLDDVRDTPSGRAFEEGFTEAVTVDLLPRYVTALGVTGRLKAGLAAAVRRYRPADAEQVAWARRASGQATGGSPRSALAAAWRARVADSWGADRWALLSAALGRPEAALRAEVPQIGTFTYRR